MDLLIIFFLQNKQNTVKEKKEKPVLVQMTDQIV